MHEKHREPSVGDIVYYQTYSRVLDIRVNRGGLETELELIDLDTNRVSYMSGNELTSRLVLANAVVRTEYMTRTELATRLTEAGPLPFTVTFTKADGTTRRLRGSLLHAEPLLGRSYVRDLDNSMDDRVRLVDHRTLQELVINNVRYLLKGE